MGAGAKLDAPQTAEPAKSEPAQPATSKTEARPSEAGKSEAGQALQANAPEKKTCAGLKKDVCKITLGCAWSTKGSCVDH